MMTYAGLQMFMEKLKQIINRNDIPFINNPIIIRERPQFQLLYDDLGSISQILSIDKHQDLRKVNNELKKRFMDAAEEAQYIVDLFLSAVRIWNNGHFHTSEDFKHRYDVRRSFIDLFLSCVHIRNNKTSHDPKRPLNLHDVWSSFRSIEVEFMSMGIDNTKMDSSLRTPNQISTTRTSSGSKKTLDEIFVGLDRDAEMMRDKLVEDQKKLNVVSIVGMGGIGKTTVATKVFNDSYIKHRFHIRVWVTVSQTYDKRGVLIQILESIHGQLDLEKASDSRLYELVHKQLMGQRYLVVIDDIWHVETWDNLKLFFPHGNNGSRILLTSRITEVAKHANSDGLIHHLGYLSKEKGWELLCQKVFCGKECPKWSIKPGMQIVESCHGLPLSLVVIAGVLSKETLSENLWVEIANMTSSYIVGDHGCLEMLGLSYNHLPLHLRECFLYLGGFPEDYKLKVKRLIRLWVAEGFIKEDGNRSLEDIAEGYLMDLIDRNLVVVSEIKKSNGGVKACKVHDLVRELCLKKAKEERFILQTKGSPFSTEITHPYKSARMFTSQFFTLGSLDRFIDSLRSVLWCSSETYMLSEAIECLCHFVLLRVLDLQNIGRADFPRSMGLLVHLRYLVIWKESAGFPSSICNLWNLQTLIYITSYTRTVLPNNIPDLVNLRHLWSYHPCSSDTRSAFILRSIEKPMNLQTISKVMLGYGVDRFHKCFPHVKELRCTTFSGKEYDFKSLTYLEKLKLTVYRRLRKSSCDITFPTTLKTLELVECRLPWSDMFIIQSLPNLEVLKLMLNAFEGSYWNTDEQEFRQLKFLRLEMLDIKLWEVYSPSFPCLKRLEILHCFRLEEIPLEIGDIPTLEVIKINNCGNSVDESVRRIQEEQHDNCYDMGNYDLKINIMHNYYDYKIQN